MGKRGYGWGYSSESESEEESPPPEILVSTKLIKDGESKVLNKVFNDNTSIKVTFENLMLKPEKIEEEETLYIRVTIFHKITKSFGPLVKN